MTRKEDIRRVLIGGQTVRLQLFPIFAATISVLEMLREQATRKHVPQSI